MGDPASPPDLIAPYVFVSYASADRDRVLPVVEALRRAGVPVWLDQHAIAGGENYALEIADAIAGCAALMLLCSAASLASRNVKQEIALAWKYERPYLPLLLEPVAIPRDIEYWLEGAQWIEVLNTPEAHWLPQIRTALEPLGIIAIVESDAPPLAGREREQEILRRHLATVRTGSGSLALIGGEAGIGKTTLAEALLHEAARQGCTVLEGHCFDLAETPPYGPWIDLFAHLPVSAALPPLPDAFARRGTVGAVASQMALFVAVEDFLRALTTERPAVLLLDDLHWSDPASLDLLRFLARSLATLPLLILVTYRSDELTRKHPLFALLPQLARDAAAERLDLTRLDDDAVRSLVVARYALADADASRLVAYLQARAEGNALFVGELLRALEEERTLRHEKEAGWMLGALDGSAMPPLLRQVIETRLSRLDAESQRLLAVAAVIGHEVPLAVWATVAETDEETVLDVVEQGLETRLLVEVGGDERVRFAHALIRETLYEGIPGIRRRRIHRRVGETLAATVSPDPDAVAYHFQQASDERAAEWLVRAGERAQAAWAYDTAATRYDEALALLEGDSRKTTLRYGMLLRLTRLRRFSNSKASIAYAKEALRLAEETGDDAMTAAARYRLGTSLCYAYRHGEGLTIMKATLTAFEELPVPAWERLAALDWMFATSDGPVATYAARLAEAGRFAEAEPLASTIVAAAASPDEVLPDAALALAYINQSLGRIAEARRMWNLGRVGSAAKGEFDNAVAFAYGDMASVVLVYQADCLAERAALVESTKMSLQRATSLFAGVPLESLFPHVDFIEGRWQEMHRVLSMLPQENSARRLLGMEPLAALARAEGDVQTAWRFVSDDAPSGPTAEPGATPFLTTTGTQRLAAALALDADDMDGARQWLEAHDRWLAWSGAVLGQSEGQALWAQYYRQAGNMDQAYKHATQAFAHATEPRQPIALLAAHRLLGELDTDAGRYGDAKTHLQQSLALADACAAPYERALTLLAIAEVQAATGDQQTARTLVNEVRSICTPLGARPTLARADALALRLERT